MSAIINSVTEGSIAEEIGLEKGDEILKINGLTHGTNTWKDNAVDLLTNSICALTDTIAFRDDIMLDLISYGMDRKDAFFIMEHVRKGIGLTSEQEEMMRAFSVPDWYIESCKKRRTLFFEKII